MTTATKTPALPVIYEGTDGDQTYWVCEKHIERYGRMRWRKLRDATQRAIRAELSDMLKGDDDPLCESCRGDARRAANGS